MALFTDGQITTIDNLRQYESSVLDVANTEGIDLEAKLQLANREIGVQLTAFLLQERPNATLVRELQCPDVARNLSRVLVTEALAQWHTLHSLTLIYRDAYNSQLNDRYLGKWQEYEKLGNRAMALCLEVGLGIVSDPVAQPALPNCGTATGGSQLATTYYIQIAWQNARGSIGALSDLLPVNLNSGTVLTVSPVNPPTNATGWFIYAGLTDSSVLCQNVSPLPLAATWYSPINGLSAGVASPAAQKPDFFVKQQRRLPRG